MPCPRALYSIVAFTYLKVPADGKSAYFLTFLPDAVDRPPSHVQTGQPLTGRYAPNVLPAPRRKAVQLRKEISQLAHRQTQNKTANPKSRNNYIIRHKHSRKGKPWLPEEEELLVESRRNWGLPWSTVTRLCSD
jgi:hypothetical protein